MKLYIVRHGETKWNVTRRLQGRSDISLNENGVALAKDTKEGIKGVTFDYVIASPLKRAIETAEILLDGDKVPMILDERIQEIGFGVWEGLSCMEDNYEIPDKDFLKFFSDPYHYKPPMGGETIFQVIDRAKAFYEELIANPKFKDKTILIVTHGCATRAILYHVYEDHEDFWHGCVPPNCCLNVVEIENGVSKLVVEDKIFYDKSRIVRYRK